MRPVEERRRAPDGLARSANQVLRSGSGCGGLRALMRKDAARNRAKVIAATRQLMRDVGADFSFEMVAERAQVGRPTIYRNFNSRHDLYEVVLDHELELIRTRLAELPEDDFLAFVRLVVEMMMIYDKFLAALPTLSDYKPDGVSEKKISDVMEAPLRRAQAIGILRPDLTSEDVYLASRMIAANWPLDFKPDMNATFERRIDLMLKGLAP